MAKGVAGSVRDYRLQMVCVLFLVSVTEYLRLGFIKFFCLRMGMAVRRGK